MKVRESGRVINTVVMLATGVNADEHREVLGLRVATTETGPAWHEFFADLVARSLTGARLVTSDAQRSATSPTPTPSTPNSTGSSTTPATSSPPSPTTSTTPGPTSSPSPPSPTEVWHQIWSNNPTQRLNREIRRPTDSVGIFPNRAAIVRPIGAVPAKQTDEQAEGRHHLGLEILAKNRKTPITNQP